MECISLTSLSTGFWGGLVPENAFNASALEGLLSAGVLGLKVTISEMILMILPAISLGESVTT